MDDISSATSGDPGAKRVGADAVTGTPHALPAGKVDGQLSQILAGLNSHVGAASGAHAASAIAAAAHSHISGASVQAQLQEIVDDLESTHSSLGAAKVGNAAVSGSPNSLSAGTVRERLPALLADINDHKNDSADAHDASAISVADAGGIITATDVEDALQEVVGNHMSWLFRKRSGPSWRRPIRSSV